MEDMWNLRACLNRSSGQPCPAPSTVNQVLIKLQLQVDRDGILGA